jgi:hypothetical protein
VTDGIGRGMETLDIYPYSASASAAVSILDTTWRVAGTLWCNAITILISENIDMITFL